MKSTLGQGGHQHRHVSRLRPAGTGARYHRRALGTQVCSGLAANDSQPIPSLHCRRSVDRTHELEQHDGAEAQDAVRMGGASPEVGAADIDDWQKRAALAAPQ